MIKAEPTDFDSENAESGAIEAFQKSALAFAFTPDSKSSSSIVRRSSRLQVRDVTAVSEHRKVKKRPASDDEEAAAASLKRHRSSSPTKKKRVRGFAHPEVYKHLAELHDHLANGLDVMFCGINPGQRSATIGHHFAGHTNDFWTCLFESGFTPRRLPPQEDYTLPAEYSLGLTNIVARPTAEESELSPQEQVDGVPLFLSKVAEYRPFFVCFVGMGIADKVSRFLKIKDRKTPGHVGLEKYKYIHSQKGDEIENPRETLFFTAPSTSGRVVQYQRKDKIKIFKTLKETVDSLKKGQIDTTGFQEISAKTK
ncbi:uracil-DNA glycosylase-like protein [Infundibulicybe gibba]|nr:uracil-DNA glycosylase-like protein [Infundibulicybe gibba]